MLLNSHLVFYDTDNFWCRTLSLPPREAEVVPNPVRERPVLSPHPFFSASPLLLGFHPMQFFAATFAERRISAASSKPVFRKWMSIPHFERSCSIICGPSYFIGSMTLISGTRLKAWSWVMISTRLFCAIVARMDASRPPMPKCDNSHSRCSVSSIASASSK